MLTRHDLRWNYKTFQVGSALNIFPVTFDPVTGQMKIQESGWRNFIFKIIQTLQLFHVSYIILRIVQTRYSSGNSYSDVIPLMFIMYILLMGMFLYINFTFVTRAEENAKVYNELLRILGEII